MKHLKAKHIKGILDGVPDTWEVGMFITEPYDFAPQALFEGQLSFTMPIPKTHSIYEIRISPGRITFYDHASVTTIKKGDLDGNK